jgi:hypothetical protein
MDNTQLRNFFDRRHPLYASTAAHWAFLEATYQGGREWFENNIFSYQKEGKKELKARKERAYRFNHTREVVDLVQKYLFKGVITRNKENAPEVVKKFWERSTLQNMRIDQFMRSASSSSSVKGRSALVVDNNVRPGAVSIAEAKESNMRIYAYLVDNSDILDFAFDEDGDGGLLWVKLREYYRDDTDPLTSTGDVIERVRLWTRTEWMLFEEIEDQLESGQTIRGPRSRLQGKPQKKVVIKEQGVHELGRVPVIFLDHIITDNPYRTPSLIDDIAYLDRAVANYLSNLDAIIQDQTFSQLTMPAQSLLPGEEPYNKLVEASTKRVVVYDGGQGATAKPEFISPDPKQANVIITVINKIINEIYHTIGLAGERTKEDNAVGIDNSSGVAKAYDFERVNSLLTSKGQSLEKAENELVELVCLWAKETLPETRLVKYPESYDVMRLADELAVAEQLAKIDAPKEVRREQLKLMVDKLFPQLKKDVIEKIRKDIDKWLEGVDLLAPPSTFGKSAVTPSRQGQVTKSSPNKQASAATK